MFIDPKLLLLVLKELLANLYKHDEGASLIVDDDAAGRNHL